MNATPPSPTPRRFVTKLATAALVIGICAGAIFFWLTPRRDSVTWLQQGSPLQQSLLPPGPLQNLKLRVQRFADPLWQKVIARRAAVSLDTRVVAVPDGTNLFRQIKTAPAGVRDGVWVWVLPADQWSTLADQLKTAPHAESLGNLRMQTIERMQSQMAIAGRAIIDGKPIAVGTELRFLTRAGGSGIRLSVVAEITEQLHQFTASARTVPVTNSVIQTNLSAALQASVPEGGALVLARETTNRVDGRTLWLIVSPARVNPQGRP